MVGWVGVRVVESYWLHKILSCERPCTINFREEQRHIFPKFEKKFSKGRS